MRKVILVIGILLFSSLINAAQFDSSLQSAFNDQEEVAVIILLKTPETSLELNPLSVSSVSNARIKTITAAQQTVLESLQTKAGMQTSSSSNFKLQKQYNTINALAGNISRKGIELLAHNSLVERIYVDTLYHILPSSTSDLASSVSVPAIGGNQTRETYNLTGFNITVAVLDTGIDYRHPALGGCTAVNDTCRVFGGYDYVNNDADPLDDNGHGTHVAGIIGANSSTITGVAPQARFLAYKVCNSGGSCSTSNIISGIDHAIGNNSKIISISIGGEATPNNGQSALSLAIQNAVDQGVTVVVAAGNNGPSTGCVTTPGDAIGVITVANGNDGATIDTTDDSIYSSSCTGPSAFGRFDPDLTAPGTSITSTYLNNGTASLTGTSMATPHVSGAAALLLQSNATLSPADIRAKLMHTAIDLSAHPFSQGAGLINITKALEYDIRFNISGTDRWETLIFEGGFATQNITIFNYHNYSLTVNFTATNLTDLEGNFILNSTILGLPANTTLAAKSQSIFTINITMPSNVTPSIYGGTILVFTNETDRFRLPLAVTIVENNEETIIATVDQKRSTCSNSACGDKIFYAFNLSSSNRTILINWSNSTNNLNLYIYNNSGSQLASSTSSSSTGETTSVGSSYDLLWILVQTINLVTNNADLVYNITFDIFDESTTITFTSPENNSYHAAPFNLDLHISDNNNISTSYFNITNNSGSSQISRKNNSILNQSFTWTDYINLSWTNFTDGNYSLILFANDSGNNQTLSNITFVIDKTYPRLSNVTLTPSLIHNNDSLTLTINITELYLNSSRVYLESNVSGVSLVNYSMNLQPNSLFNYTFTSANLTNQKTISYRVYAFDFAGNMNATGIETLTVQNRPPSAVSIVSPLNNSVIELNNLTLFTSTATDLDGDNITFRWSLSGENTIISSQNFSRTINTTGQVNITLNVSDSYTENITSISVTINDTIPPTITSLNYSSEVHLQRDGSSQQVSAFLLDHSQIRSVNGTLNGALQNTSCNQNNHSWNCSWTLSSLSIGSYTFTINNTDNFTTPHHNSSSYVFSVTSCSDGTQNGDETGSDCGGSCSACSSSSSSSSSSSGGGGGGGGGGSSTPSPVVVVDETPESIISIPPSPAPPSSSKPTKTVESPPTITSNEPTIAQESEESLMQTAQKQAENENLVSSNFAGRAFGQINGVVKKSPVWSAAAGLTLLLFLTLLWLHYRKM